MSDARVTLETKATAVKTFQASLLPPSAREAYDDSKIESEISIIVIASDAVQLASANSFFLFLAGPRYNATGLNKLSSSPRRFSLRPRDFSPPYIFIYDSDGKWNRRFYETVPRPTPRYSNLLQRLGREREREGVFVISPPQGNDENVSCNWRERRLVAAIRPRQSFSSSEEPNPLEEETRVKRIDSGRPINSSHSANNVVR